MQRRIFTVPLALILLSAPALALQQPGGGAIPSNGNLKGYLTSEGDGTIDPATAAAVTPETFDPTCNLTFKVIARGGGQLNSFGWYNVTGQKPAPSDLHEFLGCNDGVGVTKTLAIKSDPAYKGGKIGFFMASTEGKTDTNCVKFGPAGPDKSTFGSLYYSEAKYNDDNMGANSFIHLILFDSVKYPKAFYFGWEDLYGGGDNDFEDLLTRVEGISCAGGGDACDTGSMGLCAAGVRQCKGGALQCLPVTAPGKETCNGIDDDCNGKVDEGDICPPNQVCFKGSCVGKCGAGEFQCPAGLTCDAPSGLCVDPACQNKSCPAGSVCRAGECKTACMGVVCPTGDVCKNDVCVDPCVGVTCDASSVCEGGVCKDKCACGNCPSGKACAASGKCVDAGCDTKTCGAGEVCKAGACVDGCAGVTCPEGQSCKSGKCAATPGTGGAGGKGGGAGSTSFGGKAGAGGKAGGAGGKAGGAGGKAGAGGASGGAAGKAGGVTVDAPAEESPTSGSSGCGCQVVGRADGALGLGLAALGVLAARRRRRGAA
ncbi:MAG: DUF4114 domain-containing protein [Polyangiaceae bacterium]|nr:DUF4114 domain-containing protein [Polyangiaceae bacterium]